MNNSNNSQSILITGGAGFIGSNLVDQFVASKLFTKIRILDNLSTGFITNIEHHLSNPMVEFIQGDIRDFDQCVAACSGMDIVSHQAALGSVPRSINDPVTTNAVNISGTLNVFNAARQCGIKRVVYAASSSTYGDSAALPKVEHTIGKPLSPYAVTKLVNELYANVFGNLFDMSFIGLRYFNVFGPRQNPNGAYAAVIPLYITNILNNVAPSINGDGTITRDFTFVGNVVHANMCALAVNNPNALNQVYNIACGEQTSLTQLSQYIAEIADKKIEPIYREKRMGDIDHSLADITKAKTLLGYNPAYNIKAGLNEAVNWYKGKLVAAIV
jgi:UDP-N-acetylglucosamine/UDP-N-acetylgalactosamine 4-epimerase